MSLKTILGPVTDDMRIVEERLTSWADGELPIVVSAVRQIVSSGGKRIRPGCLLLASGLGPGREPAEDDLYTKHDLAAAVEIVHTASLIHDDIVDDSRVRRGRPTLHSRLTPHVALLVGDLLYSRLLKQLTDSKHVDTFRDVADTVHRMVVGELAETLQRDNVDTSEADYMKVIVDKTGTLFACSTYVGARAGGLEVEAAENMRRFGERLGVAFQIVDDVLDVCEIESDLGKPAGADIGEGKLTLPLIHALSEDRASGRTLVAKLFRERDGTMLCAEMQRHGSLAYAMQRADEAATAAVDELDEVRDAAASEHSRLCRESLTELVGFVVARGYAALERATAFAAGAE